MTDLAYNEDGTPYLCGCPRFCPLCMEDTLRIRTMPGLGECHWHCTNPRCLTEWRVEDLVNAIEQEELYDMP